MEETWMGNLRYRRLPVAIQLSLYSSRNHVVFTGLMGPSIEQDDGQVGFSSMFALLDKRCFFAIILYLLIKLILYHLPNPFSAQE